MKPCLSCASEVEDDATRCPHCGTVLAAGDRGTIPAPPAADEALQYSHSGQRFLLGYGTDFFGIWDRQGPAQPVSRYPRTDDGWREAWLAFVAQEPNSAEVGIAPTRWSSPEATAATRPPANRMATASLVFGILGLLLGPFSIPALVLGYRARSAGAARAAAGGAAGAAAARSGQPPDRGLATAGIVLGWVGLALWILWLVLLATGAVENPLGLGRPSGLSP
ncbi:MAG: hypothetical protein WD965_03000 [Actinomycetota bacterium]